MKTIQYFFLTKKHSICLISVIVLLFSSTSVFSQYQFCRQITDVTVCVVIEQEQTPCSQGLTPVLSDLFTLLNQNAISTILQLPASRKYTFQQGVSYSGYINLTRPWPSSYQVSYLTLSHGEAWNETHFIQWQFLPGHNSQYADLYFELTPNAPNINPEELFTDILKFSFAGTSPSSIYQEFGLGTVTSGHIIHTEPEWTSIFPEVAQMILRDPPGDGSYSFFEAQSESCHAYGFSLATESSEGTFTKTTLGVAGSVGLIASTDFEVYSTVSNSLEMGVRNTETNETQICFRAMEQFSTSAGLSSLTGTDGDVFIGASIEYAYGIGYMLTNDCATGPRLDTSMIFSPIRTVSSFAYTEQHLIDNIIPALQSIIQESPTDSEAHEQATDQLEIWTQLININQELKAEADFEVNRSFSAGADFSFLQETTTAQMKAFEMNIYIESEAQTEAGLEAGGTGVSGGTRVRARNEIGVSASSSNTTTNTIGYFLSDDDTGDEFSVDVYHDRVYGTAVFKLQNSSATSCPYEGAYQIDQPDLSFVDGSDTTTITGVISGEQGAFQLNVCNNSNRDRTYHLEFLSETNGLGLLIEGFGENLSSTNEGVALNIPAMGCLENALISISQTNQDIIHYEGIVFRLYSLCQEDGDPIEKAIVLNVDFSPVNSLKEALARGPKIMLWPNPGNGHLNIQFSGLPEAGQLDIVNTLGVIVYSQKIPYQNEGSLDLNLTYLPKGVYILRLGNKEQWSVQKFVIH